MIRRAIILPYKESFSDQNSGAASIFVKESLVNENLNNFLIYGSKSLINKKYKKNFFYNPIQKKYFTNYNYIKFFSKKFSHINFDTIEIHNRPEYVKEIKKKFPTSKIIFYFHNDPNTLRGSKSNKDKKFIYENCRIIFLSKWIKKKFEKGVFLNKNNIVIYPGVKQNKYKKKKKIIFFCGKLNSSKGYDIFIEATKKLKQDKKYKEWQIMSAGTESRRTLPSENHILEHGQISNKKVYSIYSHAYISIAPSKWEEPLGRLPIESSAHGCIPITSNNGGLVETNIDGIILKKNTSNELFNLLKKMLSKKTTLDYRSRKVYKNFRFTNKSFLKSISKIRNNEKKIKKILLVANLNLKNKKRLFYSFFNKLKLGLIKYPFKLHVLSDRDYIRENRILLDPSGILSFNKKVLSSVNKYNPDLIVLGHTDRINLDTLNKIRNKNKNIRIIKIFIDSISDEFFDFNKIFYDYKYLDHIFISSNPKKLSKYDKLKKIKFIPYPVDKKIDYLKSFNIKNKKTDVFFALSHGQNRGVLKKGKIDERENFLRKIRSQIQGYVTTKFIGIDNVQPLWGDKFYKQIQDSKILLNLSRGSYKHHYSSDRISTLIGNGCFVLNEKENKYNDFFNKNNELISFKNSYDLVNKIQFYLSNPKLREKIAKNCYNKYHREMNTKIVLSYIIDVIMNRKLKKKYLWT